MAENVSTPSRRVIAGTFVQHAVQRAAQHAVQHHIYLPDGRTVHAAIRGDILAAYETGTMPPLLGPVGGGS